MTGLLGGGVVRRLERHAPVALDPMTSHVVAERDVDLAVRAQLRVVEEGVERPGAARPCDRHPRTSGNRVAAAAARRTDHLVGEGHAAVRGRRRRAAGDEYRQRRSNSKRHNGAHKHSSPSSEYLFLGGHSASSRPQGSLLSPSPSGRVCEMRTTKCCCPSDVEAFTPHIAEAMMRIGVYGAGQMGAAHVRHFSAVPGTTVVGVADADEQRARSAAAAIGATPCPDLDTLLGLRPDAVVIVVPNIHPAAASIAALERGVHVFCEKPMATTVEDARSVLRTVERTGCLYQLGFNRRFAPVYIGVRELLTGGGGGVSGAMKMNDGGMRTPAGVSDPKISGGFMYAPAIHLPDLGRWLPRPGPEGPLPAPPSCSPGQGVSVRLRPST